jgi:MoaA/NifB/PqqE/SkfB family radical SAM enzyme
MMPNLELVSRLFREQNPKTIYFHAMNNLRNNLFNPASESDGLIIPNSIYIEPTLICSRRCTDCYPANLGEKSRIEEKTAHHAFETAEEMGINYVAMLGGEPLLPYVRDLTLDVIKEHKDVAVVLCTNGDFLDEKVADRLADMHNTATFLSIDGFKEKNDRRRGNGSYENATKSMSYLRERKALIGHSSTITSQNYEEITEELFMDSMIDRGSMMGSYVLFISNKDHELQPSPEQFAQAISNLNTYGKTKGLYFLSAEFGRLKGNKVMKGKRLIALTVDPFGNVRTERGGDHIAQINGRTTLTDIIKSERVQKIFARKLDGSTNGPEDGKRREIRDQAQQIINDSLQ